MSTVVKAPGMTAPLSTMLPASNHRMGPFGEHPNCAAENIGPADACTVLPSGGVVRALCSQADMASAVNDVQTMSATVPAGNIDAGSTYVLGYRGQYTAALTPTNTASDVQTALRALSTIGAGNITVGSTFPNFTFTGAGAFAGKELDVLECNDSLIDNTDPYPAALIITHTTVGQPAGDGTSLVGSRVRGFAMQKTKRGEPITLYDACILAYSDGNLAPGADYYLSSTVPGAIDTATTLDGQAPIGYAMDSQRLYVFSIR